ncbi:MAG: replication protein P [Oceanicoccus sp.]|uniref:replication protein P n=1 Tax=Oceanicoccus sp. TaxID=2691044 RepID=UPI0026120B3F|nr:replication protein P [Oceanicoccus sp.]MDG1772987.1 replication protein P [Oceanicoccus sp.]
MTTPTMHNATPTEDHITAINQMFTEFQLAYHNQFHKAFSDDQKIMMAKQLWVKTLCDLSPERIMIGTRKAIKESEYLPTLHTVRKFCDPNPEEFGLPDAYNAYLEACRAATPKIEQSWSHPIVYLAGNASDWFFLSGNSEAKAFPVFKRNYEILVGRVINGERLDMPIHKAIPENISQPLSNKERKERLQAMREKLDI